VNVATLPHNVADIVRHISCVNARTAFTYLFHCAHCRFLIRLSQSLPTDSARYFKCGKPSAFNAAPIPADHPEPDTLFGRKWSILVIDEAHNMRNRNSAYWACLGLRDSSAIRIACTATPLHTRSEDIASMGRLIGHKAFDKDCDVVERNHSRLLNSTRRDLRKKHMEALGDNVDGYLAGEAVDESILGPIRELCLEHVLVWKRFFEDAIIRRSGSSTSWGGKRVVDIPTTIIQSAWCNLSDKEREHIEAAAADASQTCVFYFNQRRLSAEHTIFSVNTASAALDPSVRPII
jgi:hypothetical protein